MRKGVGSRESGVGRGRFIQHTYTRVKNSVVQPARTGVSRGKFIQHSCTRLKNSVVQPARTGVGGGIVTGERER